MRNFKKIALSSLLKIINKKQILFILILLASSFFVNLPVFAAVNFAPKIDYATGNMVDSNPISVAIGVLNGDGKADLAVANTGGGTVSILINIPPPSYTLLVTKSGSGSGTVTSAPVGISCGADCTEPYTSGTVVTLTPTPSAGSNFAGWSGDPDCSDIDGIVTMNADKTCNAEFNMVAPPTLKVCIESCDGEGDDQMNDTISMNIGQAINFRACYNSESSCIDTTETADVTALTVWTGSDSPDDMADVGLNTGVVTAKNIGNEQVDLNYSGNPGNFNVNVSLVCSCTLDSTRCKGDYTNSCGNQDISCPDGKKACRGNWREVPPQ